MRKRAVNGQGVQPRKRTDGRWEARALVGRQPNGKPKYKSVFGKTAQECAEKLRALSASVDSGNYFEPSKLLVGEWVQIWLKEYTGNLKVSTKSTYKDICKQYIQPAFANVRLSKLTPHMVQTFINDLSRDNARSANTVKNINAVLQKCIGEAARIGYIHDNPCTGTKLPKVAKTKISALSEGEIKAFLQTIKGARFERLFTFALNTGMRLSEILGLRWSRVDFDKSLITVDAQWLIRRDMASQLDTPKNGKPRTFKAPPAVMDILRAVKADQAAKRLRAGELWNNPNDFCFTDEIGAPLAHYLVEYDIKAAFKKAGFTGYHFHSLRHTFAVEALRAGVDPKTVSEILGHSKVSFTLDIYVNVTHEMQDAAADKLQSFFAARF